MSRSAREWLGTLAGAAAAALWTIHDHVGGLAGVVLAAAAGACIALTFSLLIKLARNS